MKRTIELSLFCICSLPGPSASGQVVPSAYAARAQRYRRRLRFHVPARLRGQWDRADEPQPPVWHRRLRGRQGSIAGSVLRAKAAGCASTSTSTSTRTPTLIGPKVPIHTFKGFTPYGKFLVGFGQRQLPERALDRADLRRRRGLPAEQTIHAARLRLRVSAVDADAHAASVRRQRRHRLQDILRRQWFVVGHGSLA